MHVPKMGQMEGTRPTHPTLETFLIDRTRFEDKTDENLKKSIPYFYFEIKVIFKFDQKISWVLYSV